MRPDGDEPAKQHIPLSIDGVVLATLGVEIYLGLDSSGKYLKACKVEVLRVFRVLRVLRLLRELGARTILTTLIRDPCGTPSSRSPPSATATSSR